MDHRPEPAPSPLPWLLLWRMPGISSAGVAEALDALGGASSLLGAGELELRRHALPNSLRKAVLAYQRGPDAMLCKAQADREQLCSLGAQVVHLHDALYPQHLREIPQPPPILCVRGQTDCLAAPRVAVVGSRKATPTGKEIAFNLARELASAGLSIGSGLAYGIDAAAHRGALAQATEGVACTVAVLGSGIDRVYPAAHSGLADQVAHHGALVSEFPPGTPPIARNFPRRNRIISGLSLGVLVVEASLRSGSLITARLAREQNRELFAVPGSVYNSYSRGCHALIRSGAKLVENCEDVLEELEGQFRAAHARTSPGRVGSPSNEQATGDALGDELAILLEAVGFEPTSADLAIARTRLDAATVTAGLSELEIRGLVEYTPVGYVRTPPRSE